MTIVPAIIPKSFRHLKEKVELISGTASEVQVDVSDGVFTDNKTWPFEGDDGAFEDISNERAGLPSWENVDYEFDLMVANPREVIPDYVRAGASRVIIHKESIEADALTDLISEWKHVVDIGIALRPKTDVSEIEQFLHEISFVQFMGSNRIGFQGVKLDESVFQKISAFRKSHPEHIISVDIGVNAETAPLLIEAGATRLVMGSAIFASEDPRGTYLKFKKEFSNA